MIYRTIKDKNYSIIDNKYLTDKDLSLGAIGLMTIILKCKDDTKFSMNLISVISGKSVKVLTKYVNELKKHYYINVKKYNTKDGFNYDYFIYENNEFNPKFKKDSPDTQNPIWESPSLDKGIYYNNYNKQDKIDKTNFELSNITEYIVNKGLIKLNDMELFAYDDFIKELLITQNYKKLVKSISYTTNHIIKNKFLDSNDKPIKNLFNYFKSSVISNIERQYTNEELQEMDDLYNFDNYDID